MKITRHFLPLLFIWFVTGANGEPPSGTSSKITLAPLPYPQDALEPYISERTLSFHYTKHHQGYVDKLIDLVKLNHMTDLDIEGVIKKCYDDPPLKSTFIAAAQTWNHSFYWASMKKNGGGLPTRAIKNLIEKTFGSYETFKAQFVEAGTNLVGSGWVWLVQDKDKALKIVTTSNADLPIVHGQNPLLTCDIWEHAYYLDYQNRRKDYVTVFLDHLVNWDFANQNLS